MPTAAPRPCTHPGCALLVNGGGLCDTHSAQRARESDARRGTAASRGYTSRWAKARAAYLRAHPLCECPDCQAGAKRITVATVVDHIKPHKGDRALFWDSSNWQAMSKACHDSKTAREDGGFGRAPALSHNASE